MRHGAEKVVRQHHFFWERPDWQCRQVQLIHMVLIVAPHCLLKSDTMRGLALL
jgi:hypothetical protein